MSPKGHVLFHCPLWRATPSNQLTTCTGPPVNQPTGFQTMGNLRCITRISTRAVGVKRILPLLLIVASPSLRAGHLSATPALSSGTWTAREHEPRMAVDAAFGSWGRRMLRRRSPHPPYISAVRPARVDASEMKWVAGGSSAADDSSGASQSSFSRSRTRRAPCKPTTKPHPSGYGREAPRTFVHHICSLSPCIEGKPLKDRQRKSAAPEAGGNLRCSHLGVGRGQGRRLICAEDASQEKFSKPACSMSPRRLSASDATQKAGALSLQEHRAELARRRRMEEDVLSRRWGRRNQQFRERWSEEARKRPRAQSQQESVHLRGSNVVIPLDDVAAERMYTSLFPLPKKTLPTVLLSLRRRILRDVDSNGIRAFAGSFSGPGEDTEQFLERSLAEQTKKIYVRYSGTHVTAYACTMIGRRLTDEDALVVNATSKTNPNLCFEALFDGHGGHEAAEFAANNAAHFFGNLATLDPQTLTDACLSLDAAILQSPAVGRSGATGLVVFIERVAEPEIVTVVGREIVPEDQPTFKTAAELICQDERKRGRRGASLPACPPPSPRKKIKLGAGDVHFKLTVANIGDSRALLIHENGKYTRLSRDHKPSVAAEAQRIVNAGGFINYTDTFRVNGVMSLSRAFGDADMKQNPHRPLDKQLITAVPDVRSFVAKTSDVLLVACDGLYEPREMTPQYVASFVHTELRRESHPEKVLFRVVDAAFDFNSGDNISAILTLFREHRSLKEKKKTAIIRGRSEVYEFS